MCLAVHNCRECLFVSQNKPWTEVVNRHFCPASSLPTTTLSGFPSTHLFFHSLLCCGAICILFLSRMMSFQEHGKKEPNNLSSMESGGKPMVRFWSWQFTSRESWAEPTSMCQPESPSPSFLRYLSQFFPCMYMHACELMCNLCSHHNYVTYLVFRNIAPYSFPLIFVQI